MAERVKQRLEEAMTVPARRRAVSVSWRMSTTTPARGGPATPATPRLKESSPNPGLSEGKPGDGDVGEI